VLFTSLPFLWLLLGTLLVYYAAARTAALQIGTLVAASLVFYAWEDPALLILLALCTGVAAGASWAVAAGTRGGRWQAAGAIALLLGLLAYFKYARFLYGIFIGAGGHRSPEWDRFLLGVPLPIGISFYVFHGISLLVDTRRGDWKPAPGETLPGHLGKTTLYMVFFPQLISGPITKARDFFPQIPALKKWSDVDLAGAARLLVVGYFFKRVVADNLDAETIAMTHPEALSGPRLLLLMVGYSCQIFADFMGYSTIALGLARLFGYRLPLNFDRPYASASFSEFWRRWHISLSAWLRDYLFIPLGGSRRGTGRTLFNLFLVMFLGGLWHGAAWHYVLWGVLHGAALAAERPFLPREGAPDWREWPFVRTLRVAFVFAVVTLGWLIFRPHHDGDVAAYLAAMGRNWRQTVPPGQVWPLLLCCLPVLLHHARPAFAPEGFRPGMERTVLAAMLFLLLVNSGTPGAFIYFQF